MVIEQVLGWAVVIVHFLINKRNQALHLPGIKFIRKFGLVSVIDPCRPRTEIRKSPESEDSTCPRPCKDGKARPFKKFAQIVGRSDILEPPASGKVMAGVSGFP